jgi:cytochrome b subunit of formate dehydrogenase
MAANGKQSEAGKPAYIERFNLQFRLQHMVLFTSVILLVLTGIPLWLLGRPDWIPWGQYALQGPGFLEKCRLVHRVAGLALTAVSVYHMIYVIGTREGRRNFFLLIPTPKDFLDVFQNSLYFLHLTDKRPKFGRFAYYEKFDYWAVYWGCVIMIGTGFSLWFSDIVTQYVPWLTFKLSALVHADEAILCALALFIWHFYNVHYMPGRFPGTLLFLHGRMSHEEMQHEHPLEYEELMQKEQKDGAGQ